MNASSDVDTYSMPDADARRAVTKGRIFSG
jgi:hypothetical protein